MANPFSARFDSKCQECGDILLEGDDTFAIDGMFVCEDCAKENGNVCRCGNFKKEEYTSCYECAFD